MSDAEELADYERIVEIIRAQMALEQHQQQLPDATFEEIEFGRVDADRQIVQLVTGVDIRRPNTPAPRKPRNTGRRRQRS
jgi:hypothetical protein